MILITGANGQLGRIVIQHLLGALPAEQIVALVRDEHKVADLRAQGVQVRVGDYDDTAALGRAMQGIDRVLLIAGTDEQRRVQQHRNVLNAARAAGVGGVGYTSRTLKDRATLANQLMEGHFQTEDDVRASGLPYAIFRNVLYMDAIAQFVGERVFETGITLPAGEGRVAFALRSDMGQAIANSLLSGDWQQTVYHLTGSQAYSFADIAATLSELSGRAVAYIPADAPAFQAQMVGRGVPEVVAGRVVGFMTDIKNGQEDEVSADLERLLGHQPTPLREGLKTLFKL